jgi:uncharacterized linocin/CFP29 family protein
MNLGRDRLDWTPDIWKLIDDAVHDEFIRTSVVSRFVPLHGPLPDAITVPADIINLDTMTIDEAAVTPLVELWVEFGLTPQQVAGEAQLSTALTLATRAANLLSQAEDAVLFRGDAAFADDLFKRVQHRNSSAGTGILGAAGTVIPVKPAASDATKYGEHTFEAVVEAYSLIQGKGHYGPYALALRTEVYADTYAPLPETLATPADRIRPFVPLGFFGTGTLPAKTGVFVSVGGNSMDLVAGVDPITEFLRVDDHSVYRFRVVERFALRVKDKTAIARLEFSSK